MYTALFCIALSVLGLYCSFSEKYGLVSFNKLIMWIFEIALSPLLFPFSPGVPLKKEDTKWSELEPVCSLYLGDAVARADRGLND